MFEPRAVELRRHDVDNLVATYKNLILQVRNGQMTQATLEQIESMGRLFVTRQAAPTGLLIMLEESADVPDGEIRKQQAVVLREFFSFQHGYAAIVIAGNGPKAMVLRSVGRVLALGQPRLTILSSFHEASFWLASRIGIGAGELTALGDWARRLAKAPATHPMA